MSQKYLCCNRTSELHCKKLENNILKLKILFFITFLEDYQHFSTSVLNRNKEKNNTQCHTAVLNDEKY